MDGRFSVPNVGAVGFLYLTTWAEQLTELD